jgi:hypothetical protein
MVEMKKATQIILLSILQNKHSSAKSSEKHIEPYSLQTSGKSPSLNFFLYQNKKKHHNYPSFCTII